MSIDSSIIKGLFDAETLADIATMSAHTDELIVPGSQVVFSVGRKIPFFSSIRDQRFQCFGTLQPGAMLRSMMLVQQNRRDNQPQLIVNGSMATVRFDVDIVIGDNEETVTLPEFLLAILNENRPADSKIPLDKFLATCASFGLDFINGFPLFWQHMGANEELTNKAFSVFESMGSTSNMAKMRNTERVKRSLLNDTGIPVVELQLGSMDRTQTRFNNGFVDLVEAVVTNFGRVISLRAEERRIKAWLEDDGKKKTEAEIREKSLQLVEVGKMARQFSASWSGARRLTEEIQDPTTGETHINPTNEYRPEQAPIGRFVILNGANEEVPFSFWGRNNPKPAEGTAVTTVEEGKVVDTTGEVIAAEEPF